MKLGCIYAIAFTLVFIILWPAQIYLYIYLFDESPSKVDRTIMIGVIVGVCRSIKPFIRKKICKIDTEEDAQEDDELSDYLK